MYIRSKPLLRSGFRLAFQNNSIPQCLFILHAYRSVGKSRLSCHTLCDDYPFHFRILSCHIGIFGPWDQRYITPSLASKSCYNFKTLSFTTRYRLDRKYGYSSWWYSPEARNPTWYACRWSYWEIIKFTFSYNTSCVVLPIQNKQFFGFWVCWLRPLHFDAYLIPIRKVYKSLEPSTFVVK